MRAPIAIGMTPGLKTMSQPPPIELRYKGRRLHESQPAAGLIQRQLALVWSLMLGVALISICSGIQGTLLGIRAALENFPVDQVGLIMSAYYIGFLFGARQIPKWVKYVGHIRVFAALASTGSVAILLHSTFIDPFLWFCFRLFTGFCFSGLYMIPEGWLNQISTNEDRGRLLGAYMFTVALGFVGGQFLISLWPPIGFELFILASVVLSVAVVPILLSNIAAPVIAYSENLELNKLIKVTPLGTMGVFTQGVTFGAIMWLTAVFGKQRGFSDGDSALLVGALMLGGLALQLPIGRLSDRQDRRRTLMLLSLAAMLACLLVPGFASFESIWPLACLLFLAGGAVLSFYSVSMSHINDHLESGQILSASSSIIFINGLGGLAGPVLSTQAMKVFGPNSLYYFVALVYLFMALFTLYRISVRPPIDIEEQSEAMAVMMQTSQVIVAEAMDETDQGNPLAPEHQEEEQPAAPSA